MTTNTSLNAELVVSNLVQNNTLTGILGLDTGNNLKYRNSSTIGPLTNQSLNTTDNVSFSMVITNAIYGQNNALNMLTPLVTYYGGTVTTTNSTPTTIILIPISTNTTYLIYAEISAKDETSGGGASFIFVNRVVIDAGILSQVTVKNISNKTASNSIGTASVSLSMLGLNANLQVGGVENEIIKWTGLFRVVASF